MMREHMMVTIGNRNDPCPCGSGRKYKKCCMGREGRTQAELADFYFRRHGIRLKTAEEIQGIRTAGELVLELLELAENLVVPGAVTGEIDDRIAEETLKRGAISAPLNYRGFPRNTCISVNEVICHGIPGERVLQEGDIVNVDVTPILGGYYADANRTFAVGRVSKEAADLIAVTRESLRRGMQVCGPGVHLGDIGFAIQDYAEREGYSVVRDFVGHGVGIEFHESPQVPHFGRKGTGVKLAPGMVFTIEPMINIGRKDSMILDDGWTAVTVDGSLSAQFEQTILVTEDGFESLTPYDPEYFSA